MSFFDRIFSIRESDEREDAPATKDAAKDKQGIDAADIDTSGISASYEDALSFMLNETRKLQRKMLPDDLHPLLVLEYLSKGRQRADAYIAITAFIYAKTEDTVRRDMISKILEC